jgi:hypothetical protein
MGKGLLKRTLEILSNDSMACADFYASTVRKLMIDIKEEIEKPNKPLCESCKAIGAAYKIGKETFPILTPVEWWSFAPWQSMDSAQKDGMLIMARDQKNNVRITMWDEDYEGWLFQNREFKNPVAWIPLPE